MVSLFCSSWRTLGAVLLAFDVLATLGDEPQGTVNWQLTNLLLNDPAPTEVTLGGDCPGNLLPRERCVAGGHLYVDSIDNGYRLGDFSLPGWDRELKRLYLGLKRECKMIPKENFIDHCHHQGSCDHPVWGIIPLLVAGVHARKHLEGYPFAAKFLSVMERRIPGLFSVAIARMEPGSASHPHCDGADGSYMTRFSLSLRMTGLAAMLRFCTREYAFEEGHLVGYNSSMPHEIANPSTESFFSLVFDVLNDDVIENDESKAAAMAYAAEHWSYLSDNAQDSGGHHQHHHHHHHLRHHQQLSSDGPSST